MQKSEIKVGEEYALRETLKTNEPFQRVKILEHTRRNKWRAEWIEPNPGLVDYVESSHLIVRWKGRQAFLRDEERARQLHDDNERQGFTKASPIDNALSEVFESVGEQGLSFYRNMLSGPPEALERVRERARFDLAKKSPYTYVDRHGTVHVPVAEALELAKAFCAAEPSTVLAGVESTERGWSHEVSQPGKEYMVNLLNEYRAAWAMIRQWTGHDPAIAQREAHIQRLERLVWDAIYALQKAGADAEANRLRRVLQRD
jgi:hypothetical protein